MNKQNFVFIFILAFGVFSCNSTTQQNLEVDSKSEIVKLLEKHGLNEEDLVEINQLNSTDKVDLEELDKKLSEIAPVIKKMNAHILFSKKAGELSKSFWMKKMESNSNEEIAKQYDAFFEELLEIDNDHKKSNYRSSVLDYYKASYYEDVYNVFIKHSDHFDDGDLEELKLNLIAVKVQIDQEKKT